MGYPESSIGFISFIGSISTNEFVHCIVYSSSNFSSVKDNTIWKHKIQHNQAFWKSTIQYHQTIKQIQPPSHSQSDHGKFFCRSVPARTSKEIIG